MVYIILVEAVLLYHMYYYSMYVGMDRRKTENG